MKRFIYLDTNELNSYIAQIYNGLSIEKDEVIEKKKNSKEQKGSTLGTKLNIAAKIKGLLNLEGEVNTNILEQRIEEADEVIKDIKKKIIHDESFDKFLNYLEQNNLLVKENYKVGDFITSNSEFKIFDLNYFLKLFEEDGIIDFLNKKNKFEIQQIIEKNENSLNRESRRKNKDQIQEIKDEAEEKLIKQSEEYNSIKDVIKAIKSILPYEKIILVDHFFLATDDKYFRDSSEMLGFKYGGKISFVGYITNIVNTNESTQKNEIDTLTELKKMVNSTILNLINNKGIFVVHPIAIYYE